MPDSVRVAMCGASGCTENGITKPFTPGLLLRPGEQVTCGACGQPCQVFAIESDSGAE